LKEELSLQNETPDEILATRLPDGGETLYTKENI
jgi:DNA-directed RNA polymerase subunit beta